MSLVASSEPVSDALIEVLAGAIVAKRLTGVEVADAVDVLERSALLVQERVWAVYQALAVPETDAVDASVVAAVSYNLGLLAGAGHVDQETAAEVQELVATDVGRFVSEAGRVIRCAREAGCLGQREAA